METRNVITSPRVWYRPEDVLVVPVHEQIEIIWSHEISVITLERHAQKDLRSGSRVLLVDGVVDRSVVPSVPFPMQIPIDTFVLEGEHVSLVPALPFSCDHDAETGLYELTGASPYDDVLLYGGSVGEMIRALEEEVLPMFWEDGMDEDAKLSPKMQGIVRDLKCRAKLRA